MDYLRNYSFNKIPDYQGAQANVYVHDKYALKVYKGSNQKAEAFYEAMILAIIENSKFITPKIYQVTKTTNWTLVMDYFKGDLVADVIEHEGKKLFDEIIKLQVVVNNTNFYLPVRVEEKLKGDIRASTILNDNVKSKLIDIADNLSKDNKLCHGDFHIRNLIKVNDGIAIIDWVDATIGDSIADGCRSYLLYKLFNSSLAEHFLKSYCEYRNINTLDLLRVLPLVAGARLSENNEEDHKMIFEIIKTHL